MIQLRTVCARAGAVLALAGCAGCAGNAWLLRRAPARGDTFPDLPLHTAAAPDATAYLGIVGAPDSARLSDIRADTVLLVVLDMYCRYCQKAAPQMQRLHEHLPRRAARAKLLGIGIGNSEFETALFRDKYGLTFPILPDPDNAVRDRLGRVSTPTFFTLQRDASGTWRVRHKHTGPLDTDAAEFLDAALP